VPILRAEIVCPGFVDPHTHDDAQRPWDPLLSNSAEHGMTTDVMGNCGVGIAPCKPTERAATAEETPRIAGLLPEAVEAILDRIEPLIKRGAMPQILTRPQMEVLRSIAC
jgi:N-acyl-D-aspartate/D-glutamate deacylase